MNDELLSRIAETLYWTGRYVERADDTARLVDVYVHRMLAHALAGQRRAAERLGPHVYLRFIRERAALPAQLPELLSTLQQTCVQASEAIAKRYFQYQAPVAWARDG